MDLAPLNKQSRAGQHTANTRDPLKEVETEGVCHDAQSSSHSTPRENRQATAAVTEADDDDDDDDRILTGTMARNPFQGYPPSSCILSHPSDEQY